MIGDGELQEIRWQAEVAQRKGVLVDPAIVLSLVGALRELLDEGESHGEDSYQEGYEAGNAAGYEAGYRDGQLDVTTEEEA